MARCIMGRAPVLIHDTMGASSLPARAPAVWARGDLVDQRSATGWPPGPFLFAADIQAALDALPPGGTMHRWYLDGGVFMGSVVEIEGVLASLQQSTPPSRPRAQHAENNTVGCRPPQWQARGSASQRPTIPRYSSGTWGCPYY